MTCLTVVRTLAYLASEKTGTPENSPYLTRGLECHPLIDEITFICSNREVNLILFIVAFHEVLDNRVGLPERKVIVIMIDYGWDTFNRPG
jgi:hypothetical protein